MFFKKFFEHETYEYIFEYATSFGRSVVEVELTALGQCL